MRLINLSAYALPFKKLENNKPNQKNQDIEEFDKTYVLKGNLYFTLGGIRSLSLNESIQFNYENKIKFKSSTNGNDELSAIFESGNAFNSPLNLDLQSKKGNEIKITNLYYKKPIGENFEFLIGPKMFGYNGLSGKSTAYNERIAILDGSNYTTYSGNGPGIGVSYINENGLNSSFKINANDNLINDESKFYIFQVGLNKSNFGGTITGNHNEDFNAFGIAIYYEPNILPSISLSIENKDSNKGINSRNWILGIQKDLKSKTFGFAVGTHNPQEDIAYEAWSKIKITDKIEFIPVFFIREINLKNDFGIALNTSFKY